MPETSTTTKSLTPTIPSQFQCKLYPIPLQLKCDGLNHCVPDGEDEENCPETPAISSSTSIPSINATITTATTTTATTTSPVTTMKTEIPGKTLGN